MQEKRFLAADLERVTSLSPARLLLKDNELEKDKEVAEEVEVGLDRARERERVAAGEDLAAIFGFEEEEEENVEWILGFS